MFYFQLFESLNLAKSFKFVSFKLLHSLSQKLAKLELLPGFGSTLAYVSNFFRTYGLFSSFKFTINSVLFVDNNILGEVPHIGKLLIDTTFGFLITLNETSSSEIAYISLGNGFCEFRNRILAKVQGFCQNYSMSISMNYFEPPRASYSIRSGVRDNDY